MVNLLTVTDLHLHRESKKGATLTMARTLSILDRFAKFFHYCKQQQISNKTHIGLPTTPFLVIVVQAVH